MTLDIQRERELNRLIMSERGMSPEVREMLHKATEGVAGLYLGDQVSNLLRTQSPEQRDDYWNRAVQEYAPFGENIRGLREVLKVADVTKKAYPAPIGTVMALHFSGVSDETAKMLLTDILFARVTKSPGYMDYSIEPYSEAQEIVKELGVQDGLRGEQVKSVSLNQAIGAVLTGSLRTSYQRPGPRS